MSEVADIMMSESVADIKNKLKKAEADLEVAQQKAAEREQQAQQAMQKQLIDAEEKKVAREDANKAKDRQNKIDVALINANSRTRDKILDNDLNNNGIDDAKDAERVDIQRNKQVADEAVAKEKLSLERKKHEDIMNMKEKELKQKKAESNKNSNKDK